MQRPLATRKRGAPGASPLAQQSQQQFNNVPFATAQDPATSFDAPFVDWGNTDASNNLGAQYPDTSGYDTNIYDAGLNGSVGGLGSGTGVSSSQLVRRNPNQQLVSRGQNNWQDTGGGSAQPGQGGWDQMDDEEDLEQRALTAKREAQAKRKQIPPFVQKLSSFLDDNTNTELIRWSDDGDSFIVLDEDEFAKTLIPELFKHNNYASFVRQLNMYGFHKKVGLSDNSMKASENKRKTPSEYYNKFFKRGRPELLWLIQKPKNPPSAKRKREDGKGGGQGDSDDERKFTPGPDGQAQPPGDAGVASKDLTVIPKTELAALKQELTNLQRQQKVISTVIQQMKHQNDQFYRQATTFQDMHNRHENSINAILTFLATFYNRSLEGQGNLAEMFGHPLPQNSTQQGNIVDMGDFPEVELNMPAPSQMQRKPRQPLLLPAPDVKNSAASPTSPTTMPSSTRSTVSPKPRTQAIFRAPRPSTQNPTGPTASAPTPPIKTDAETPNMVSDNQDMMSVINAANSASPPTTGPGLDFDSALHHFQTADGNTPLTPQQRNDVLSMMQANIGQATSGGNTTGNNNALTNPQPPPMPSLSQISANQDQLDYLQRLQSEQAMKVQHLADRIQPLSPSGQIPGLYDANGNPAPPDFNLDDWLGDYPFPDQSFNTDADGTFNDLDFSFDGTNDVDDGANANANGAAAPTGHDFLGEQDAKLVGGGGRVESVSSRASSPNSPADLAKAKAKGSISSPKKRRKVT